MHDKLVSFIKIVTTFTFSAGFAGTLYLALYLSTTAAGEISKISEFIATCLIIGFIGGMMLYIDASFILGLILALLSPRRNFKYYTLCATLPPALILILEYFLDYPFTEKSEFPMIFQTYKENLIFAILPISSISSILAATISFPPSNNLTSQS